MGKGECMKDINHVTLMGKVTRVRHCTIKDKFAFLNINVDNVPVSMNLGGNKYKQEFAKKLEQTLRAGCYITIFDGFMDMSKGDTPVKQVVVRDDGFTISQSPIVSFSLVNIVGTVTELSIIDGNLFCTVGASYYSKKPGEQKGTYKDRFIKIMLDKQWQADITNRKIVIHGVLDSDKEAYVKAFESIIK